MYTLLARRLVQRECLGGEDARSEKVKERMGRRMARFKLGNEMREGRYWGEEEERRCRMCGGGGVVETCVGGV